MDQSGDRIFIYHTDPEIDQIFSGRNTNKPYSLHFSQNEDFFILLNDALEIPPLPIHHDIRAKSPEPLYRSKIQLILEQLANQIPIFFADMHWYFDATETLWLDFFQLICVEDQNYLFILRIDLNIRLATATVLQAGTNDQTPHYRTRRLFVEADLIPLREIQQIKPGQFQFYLCQTISETWVGETGRGYFVMGIWLDRELTKFFSRLFMATGKRIYPYYPLNCKFRCVCFQPIDFSQTGKQEAARILHQCRQVIEKNLRNIEASLKGANFSEDLPVFLELRSSIANQPIDFFQKLFIQSYLNQDDFKEYELKYET